MYQYKEIKPRLFTEEAQRDFLKVRDRAHKLLEEAGAFKIMNACKGIAGDSWMMIAYIDRLVELGEIREITPPGVAGQDRVFVEG